MCPLIIFALSVATVFSQVRQWHLFQTKIIAESEQVEEIYKTLACGRFKSGFKNIESSALALKYFADDERLINGAIAKALEDWSRNFEVLSQQCLSLHNFLIEVSPENDLASRDYPNYDFVLVRRASSND